MNVVKSLSRRAFFWVLFFSVILWLLIDAAVYFAINAVSLKLSALQARCRNFGLSRRRRCSSGPGST